jgi:hypothetical protein
MVPMVKQAVKHGPATIAPRAILIRNSFGQWSKEQSERIRYARNIGAGDTDRQVWQGGLF